MSIVMNLCYNGTDGNARKFAQEMEASGIAARIRQEEEHGRYACFYRADDPETVLLIDSWKDQASLDIHHASPMMGELAALREKYDLHMRAERYITYSSDSSGDEKFLKK